MTNTPFDRFRLRLVVLTMGLAACTQGGGGSGGYTFSQDGSTARADTDPAQSTDTTSTDQSPSDAMTTSDTLFTGTGGCPISPCPTGQRCLGDKCQPFVPCTTSKQCGQFGGLCDTKHGICVDCITYDDCAAGTCFAGYCLEIVSCNSTKDCLPMGMVCKDLGAFKRCVGCNAEADCPQGTKCIDSMCAQYP